MKFIKLLLLVSGIILLSGCVAYPGHPYAVNASPSYYGAYNRGYGYAYPRTSININPGPIRGYGFGGNRFNGRGFGGGNRFNGNGFGGGNRFNGNGFGGGFRGGHHSHRR